MHLEIAHEAVQEGKSTPLEKDNDNNKMQKNEDRRPSLDKTNKKAKALDLRASLPPLGKFMNYIDLVASQEDVFLVAEQLKVFK